MVSNDQLIQERLYKYTLYYKLIFGVYFNISFFSLSSSFAKYNKEQLFPLRSVADNNVPTLVSEWGELPSSMGLGANVYYSPRLKKTFRFDHLRREPSDWKPLPPHSPELLSALGINERAERLRGALEAAAIDYVTLHYCKQGSVEVFARSPQLPPVNHEAAGGASVAFAICIENHLFQQKNFWYAILQLASSPSPPLPFPPPQCLVARMHRNGSWRSLWVLYATPESGAGASVRLEGRMRVQVHYYEEGNVQLYTPKECSLNLTYNVRVCLSLSLSLAVLCCLELLCCCGFVCRENGHCCWRALLLSLLVCSLLSAFYHTMIASSPDRIPILKRV